MKITLRQAHKIVEKITARAAEVAVSTTAEVSIHDPRPVEQVFAEERAVYKKNLQRRQDLSGARQEIRSAVQAQNAAEVNGLVSIRKGLLDQIAILRAVHSAFQKNLPSSVPMLAAKLAAEHASSSRYQDMVVFNVLSQAERDTLEKEINTLQLRIEAVEDQLATSNAAAQITLSDITERVLRSEGIIQ